MSDTERLPPGSFGCPLIGETLSWLRDLYTFVIDTCRYLDCFWKEVLRFYPTSIVTPPVRVIKRIKTDRYEIPEGWLATGLVHATMQDPAVFSHPRRFDPDRFNEERAEDKQHANSFVPYGCTPAEGHRCLGESLSTLILKTFLIRLVRHNSFQLLETPILVWEPNLRGPSSPLRVKFKGI